MLAINEMRHANRHDPSHYQLNSPVLDRLAPYHTDRLDRPPGPSEGFSLLFSVGSDIKITTDSEARLGEGSRVILRRCQFSCIEMYLVSVQAIAFCSVSDVANLFSTLQLQEVQRPVFFCCCG